MIVRSIAAVYDINHVENGFPSKLDERFDMEFKMKCTKIYIYKNQCVSVFKGLVIVW